MINIEYSELNKDKEKEVYTVESFFTSDIPFMEILKKILEQEIKFH